MSQPLAHLGRQLGMPRRILQDAAHALGQEGRERQAAAAIGRHLGIAAGRQRALRDQLLDALEAQQAAGEDEGVARHQPLDEGLLDLAQHRPAPQLHLDQRQLDDGADIHAELPRHQRRGQHPAPVGQLLQPVPALVGRQRIAAGGDEVERVVEILARQVAIGLRAAHLVDRSASRSIGWAQAVPTMCWASTSRQAGRGGSPSSSRASTASSAASDSSTSKRLAGAIMARLGSSSRWLARPIRCIRRLHALGRAHLDHQVDVAPVDAEIERGGRDHGAQLARRHRRLDLAALLDGERAMMQADRQVVLVDAPQRVEHQLGLGARVDEHDRGLVLADDVVDLGHRVLAHVAAPRQALLGVDDARPRAAAPGSPWTISTSSVARRRIVGQRRRIGDRGRQADEARLRRQATRRRARHSAR